MNKLCLNLFKFTCVTSLMFCYGDQKTLEDYKIIERSDHLMEHPEPSEKACSTLMVSCMDFRLREKINDFIEAKNLDFDCDELVLPGASLAIRNDQKFKEWEKTSLDVLDLAHKLHQINRLIIVDHLDCGAYKLLFGKESCAHKEDEKLLHLQNMFKIKDEIQTLYPNLEIQLYIMDLNGYYERFS